MTPVRIAGAWLLLPLAAVLLGACGTQAAAPAAKPTTAPAPTVASAPAQPAASAPTAAPAAAPAQPAASSSAVAPLSPPVTVRMGKLPLVSDSGMHLAVEKGYFQEEGLQIESVPFDSAGQMVAPMGAGQLEVGGGAISAGLFNAIARDVPLRIVADKGSFPPGANWLALAPRADLADQIREYSDLRGRKIQINQLNTSNDLALERALRLGGLTLRDVDLIQLPFADVNAALANKSIEVAQHNEPFLAQAVDQGLAVRWRGVDEYYPNMQFSVILYAPHFARDLPEAARRWMVAYLRGVRDYNDAFAKGLNKAETVNYIVRQVPIRDLSLFDKMARVGLDADGKVNAQGIRDDMQWFIERGQVAQPADLDRAIDLSFSEYAVGRLGPYAR